MPLLFIFIAAPWALYDARGWPIAEDFAVTEPSGMQSLARKNGLVTTELVDEKRFDAFLKAQNLTAVQSPRLRPVVIAKGDPAHLAIYGRIENLFDGFYRIYLPPGRADPQKIADILGGMPDEWLQMKARDFNDPMYDQLWELHPSASITEEANIHADSAWVFSTGSQSIAVLDDGFLLTHEDLAPNLVEGYDFVDNDSDPSPHEGDTHGTHVMGVALAKGNNDLGISGVCPDCTGIPERVFAEEDFDNDVLLGASSDAAAAFDFAASHGARVINCSWGPIIDQFDPTFQAMPAIIDEEVQKLVTQGSPPGQTGVFFAWAAGNNGAPGAPALVSFDGWAGDPRVFSVSSSNFTATRSVYGAVGPGIRLLCPSSDDDETMRLPTTDSASNSSYATLGGTSGAAPIAAGVAALVLSAYPNLSLAQLMEILLDSADKIDTADALYVNGKSCTFGAGRVNARNAMLLAGARQSVYASGHTLHFELCGDGIDNDNDGTIDNPQTCTRCIPTENSDPPDGIDNDCDGIIDNPQICVDPNAPAFSCTPTGPEICDGIDNDCNGIVDDFTTDNAEWIAQTQICDAGQKGVCTSNVAVCVTAVWLCQPPSTYQHVETLCDGLDNDCDGSIDKGCPKLAEVGTIGGDGCNTNGEPALAFIFFVALRILQRRGPLSSRRPIDTAPR